MQYGQEIPFPRNGIEATFSRSPLNKVDLAMVVLIAAQEILKKQSSMNADQKLGITILLFCFPPNTRIPH